jgi:hypothetical protein
MKQTFAKREISVAVAALVAITTLGGAEVATAAGKATGTYVTGDFHNHTTCSDGTLSLKKLVNKSVDTFGLDWFVQAGHGGTSARNCTLAEDPFEPYPPALNNPTDKNLNPSPIPSNGQDVFGNPNPTVPRGPNQLWTNTVGNAAIKGDVSGSETSRNMWRWQMIQEFVYPTIEKESRNRADKPIFVGLEQNAPGHEHTSTVIIDGQLPAAPAMGNATAMAQFEYCFDRSDSDTSRGANNQWDCAVPGSANNSLLNPAARKILGSSGTGSGIAGHIKTVEGVKWMAAYSPQTSYYIPAHLERAGAFNPNGSNGFNIEHLRDFNNAAPTVSFGFESMPGHQAEGNRGSYTTGAVGGGTFGGTGVYAAAVGGVWDALLGEGRNWFFFASSDYHNRGSFGPDSRETTADFFPGEYTRDHVLARTGSSPLSMQAIVDGLRSGNSFVANGQLIDRLAFVACASYPGILARTNASVEAIATKAATGNTDTDVSGCATMGEKLVVRPGAEIVVSIVVRDPVGTNNSPYSFANPSLKQIGMTQPLNAPVLDHIDVIGGKVSGYVSPSNTAAYAGLIGSPAASNPTAALAKTFNSSTWTATPDGTRKMTYRIPAVTASQYVRLRGTNLPVATPFETDLNGNPLLDFGSQGKIACSDASCPSHLTTTAGVKYSSFDVAGWSDLWFYSNPIFVEVQGSTAVAGIK